MAWGDLKFDCYYRLPGVGTIVDYLLKNHGIKVPPKRSGAVTGVTIASLPLLYGIEKSDGPEYVKELTSEGFIPHIIDGYRGPWKVLDYDDCWQREDGRINDKDYLHCVYYRKQRLSVCLTCRKHHSSRREYFYDAGNGLAHRIFSSQIQTPAFIGQGHKDLFAIHYFSLGRVQKRSPCKNEKIIKYSPLGSIFRAGWFYLYCGMYMHRQVFININSFNFICGEPQWTNPNQIGSDLFVFYSGKANFGIVHYL